MVSSSTDARFESVRPNPKPRCSAGRSLENAGNDDVDGLGAKAELTVALDGFASPALEQPAVKQDRRMLRMHDVPGSGHIAAHRANEFNLHGALVSSGPR